MTSRSYLPPKQPDLRALADFDSPVVSLFVPVTAAVPNAAQNTVRHQRAVAQALARLDDLGADDRTLEEAEHALAAFAHERHAPKPNVVSRAAYWSAEQGCKTFALPFHEQERVNVAHSAALRPIARAVRDPTRYRVLLLAANEVALYEGDATGLQRVDSNLPGSLEDALGTELTAPTIQLHSTDPHGGRPGYHGQGGAPSGRRADLERFHRHVARALEDAIGEDRAPLVLAADARHRPGLERALRRDVGLLAKGVDGNPEHLSDSELHAHAWPIASEAVADPRSVLERAREDGAPVVFGIADAVHYTVTGRVRRLWIPEEGKIPARVNIDTGRAASGWGDDELLDDLAAHVLRRGGEVLVLDGEELGASGQSLYAELR